MLRSILLLPTQLCVLVQKGDVKHSNNCLGNKMGDLSKWLVSLVSSKRRPAFLPAPLSPLKRKP